ncbi:F-box/kelch-repeat protein At3g23880-like [Lycium barbarum]|uniref:F-box/kelch-repeat protein At3g23880-like n=1 Tax=Lycium barbarum TaxID=112863 RepID=UPI00293E67E6|nr:F-box/kelch-repeat protein At3g23880-like [Lycium barbarum]
MEYDEDEGSHQHPKQNKPTNKSHFSSTSIQESILIIPTLPEELIIEILLRLPVKSLLKFRSVSKSWLALISTPEFINTHLSISANNQRLVLTHHKFVLTSSVHKYQYNIESCSLSSLLNNDSVIESFDLDYPMNNPLKNVWIVGSVNGLICLAIGFTDLFLWNPSTRNFKKLPDSRPTGRPACFKYGFGYDECHDDYKVIGMFCYIHGRSRHVEVKLYSLKSDYWRTHDEDFSGEIQFARTGKFVNGRIYWANNDCRDLHKEWKIISIDLADEKWGKVEQPCYDEGYNFLLLGALGSDLSVFCNYPRTHTDVWVMKQYGVKESWTKMYTIRYPSDLENLFSSGISPTLFMSNKGEILLMRRSTFMRYNPKDESIRYTKVAKFRFCIEADIHIESLVCPFLQDEPRTQQD